MDNQNLQNEEIVYQQIRQRTPSIDETENKVIETNQHFDLMTITSKQPQQEQRIVIENHQQQKQKERHEINTQIIKQDVKINKVNQIKIQDDKNINISITKTLKKGGLIGAYYVYLISGFDERGLFEVQRRFNQFFEMRTAMVQRWPGCFVPSIPAKNAMLKNDSNIVERRKRYLNQFVKKIARLPHLYYGQEFQTLLRSSQTDVSSAFSKWPLITTETIINKYRVNFSELAGKEINYQTNEKISNFVYLIKRNQSQLEQDRQNMKKLAQSYDKLNFEYISFFSKGFPAYERSCLKQYCNKQTDYLYLNEAQAKLQEHELIARETLNFNPYWSLYDMIRHQERDGLAFIEAFQFKGKFESKRNFLEIKINENQKIIHELEMGTKSKGNTKNENEDIVRKLQKQIELYRIEKENLFMLIDIITAMIAYIQIQRYKLQKRQFYQKTIMNIGQSEINKIQNLSEIWSSLRDSTHLKFNH